MPKIAYETKALREVALYQIELANQIIVEYQALEMKLTLRGVYYQMIARDLFPDDRRWRWVKATQKWIRDPKGTKNAVPNYKWLQGLLDDGRMTGLVDWNAIEDPN